MKPRTIILLVVAVGCGLGASIMTSRLLADRKKADEPEETVAVVVAKAPVVGFMPLKEPEKLFDIKHVPVSIAPKRPVSTIEELKDQKLNKSISEDHQVLKDDLLSKDQMTLSDFLKPGQVAVAVKVNAESLAGGFVLPGAKVTVISTVNRNRDMSSRMILQNMTVLAVGDNDQRDPEKKSMVAPTVTLAATPEEAGRLKLAQSMGDLSLLLKPPGENSRVSHFVIKPEDLNNPLGNSAKAEEDEDKPDALVAGPRARTILPEVAPEKDEPAPVPVPVAPVVEARPRRDVNTHRMTIITAGNVTHKIYNRVDGDEFVTGAEEPLQAQPRPAPRPIPQVAPPPRPAPTTGVRR